MSRTSEQVMEERMLAALKLVRARSAASPSRRALVSHAQVARELGLTINEARCALRRLTSRGLVEATHRYLPNGGQVENALRVTSAGQAFMEGEGLCARGE